MTWPVAVTTTLAPDSGQPTRRPLRGIALAGPLALVVVCWCAASAVAAGGHAGRRRASVRRRHTGGRGGLRWNPRPLRGTVLAGLLALVAVCWCSGSALAAGGALVDVGSELGGGKPAVAVDSAGTAYLVWPQAVASGQAPNALGFCVLPAGAAGCSSQGTLTPDSATPGAADIFGDVGVAIDGSSVVVVASVSFAGGEPFEGVQEWIAPDGTGSFAAVDGGHAVADPTGYSPWNLLVLPGSNSLAYPFNEVGDHSVEFVAWTGTSSLTNPPTCDVKSCPTPTYAFLNEPNSVFSSQAHAEYASLTGGANQGVLGVFSTPFSACNNGNAGTSFIYGSGAQSASNSYLIAPGDPKSAWKAAIGNIDCTGYNAAVGSGPSGFGELELDGPSVVYRPFDQTHGDFDDSPVTVGATEAFNEGSVSQDGGGGVYATWNENYKAGGSPAIRFAYSSNGGTSWEGPVSLTGGANNPAEVSSAVGSGGQGWAVSTENISEVEQVFAQPFLKGDAYVPPSAPGGSGPSFAAAGLATSQSGGGESGAEIKIIAGTTGESDQAHVTGPNAAIAGGSVNYYLYADPTCDPGVGEVFNGGLSPVTDGVAAPSKPVTEALGPGTYYWQAEYSGDALNSAAKTACGAEVLTVLPATSSGSSATSNGSTVTVTVTCESSSPCTVTVTITATEVTIVVEASEARKKVKRTRTITLATGTFKVNAHGSKKLALHLTRAGKALLAKDHGHLKGTIQVGDKTSGGLVKSKRSISITTTRGRHG
jgi:hypothetical protein